MNTHAPPWRIGARDGQPIRQSDELVWIFDAKGNRVAQWVPAAVAPMIAAAPDGARAIELLREVLTTPYLRQAFGAHWYEEAKALVERNPAR